jgi:hypothetical protein
VVVVLLGARAEVYLFPAAVLVPNLIAGLLSGFVTTYVLRAFARSAETKLAEADARAILDADAAKEASPSATATAVSPRID